MIMRWYRIEFFSCSPLSVDVRVNSEFVQSHRIGCVERQYSTYGRAVAAADKMLQHRPDCIGYTLTVL